MKLSKIVSFCFLVLCTFLISTNAYSQVSVPTPSTDSRSTSDGGVFGTGGWSNAGNGFKINWNITQTNGSFNYIYRITSDPSGPLSKGLSHIIFEVSPSITPRNIGRVIPRANPSIDDGPKIFGPGPSNPGIPGDIYGIKFDVDSDTPVIEFQSTRAPIWGDFYAKDGVDPKFDRVDVYAYNTNFGTDPNGQTQDFTGWIPVPDTTEVPIPEPSTTILLGTSLAALFMKKLKKK